MGTGQPSGYPGLPEQEENQKNAQGDPEDHLPLRVLDFRSNDEETHAEGAHDQKNGHDAHLFLPLYDQISTGVDNVHAALDFLPLLPGFRLEVDQPLQGEHGLLQVFWG